MGWLNCNIPEERRFDTNFGIGFRVGPKIQIRAVAEPHLETSSIFLYISRKVNKADVKKVPHKTHPLWITTIIGLDVKWPLPPEVRGFVSSVAPSK